MWYLSNAANVLIVSTFLFLGGCAQKVFVKSGASTQDFATDRYLCERDVRQSGEYGTGLAGAMEVQGYFNRCMSAHGWGLQDKEQVTRTTAPQAAVWIPPFDPNVSHKPPPLPD